ncbi:hypothetical protein TNCV_4117961 [Trichonephila clavipes]|nr:hypothetical protein TNCV_4117961 [Trichonephila clavipes]
MSFYTNSSEKSCRTTGSVASKRSIHSPNSREEDEKYGAYRRHERTLSFLFCICDLFFNLKLYTDTQEQQHKLIHLLDVLDYEFHVIPSKAERPIKIVIKGLPRDTPVTNIHNELETLGFTIDKVSQLTGRITKQLLPIFLVTLPRHLYNSKIFDLNKL